MRLIAIIMMSVSPEEDRKMIEPLVVLMACAEWSITLVSASSWFDDNSSTLVTCDAFTRTQLSSKKIIVWCLQDGKHAVRRAGSCVTMQIYEPLLIFTISEKSLKIFWYLELNRFNDNIITASPNFSFSSLNLNISVSVRYNIHSLKSLRKRRQQLPC